MKKMHVAVLTLVAVLGAGLLPAAAQSGDAGVDQLAADYSDAWARGDAEALANLHTEDAIRSTQGGGTIIGRAAIQQEFTAILSGGAQGTKLMVTVGRSQQLTDDITINEGTFEITAGEMSTPGTFINTLVMQNGRWLIASNAVIPPPAEQ